MSVRFRWLGQAGFEIRCRDTGIVIDPYLSDSLADKYRGQELPHLRMAGPVCAPGELREVSAVLCTHAHSDHMDPGTIPRIASANPDAIFVVPASESLTAHERGVPRDRMVGLNAGESAEVTESVSLLAIPSAHEELSADSEGNHRYLGYVMRLGKVTIYHSGDCIPYRGLARELNNCGIDIALLPVNGRDEFRRSRGIAGNFTFSEALDLCHAAGIDRMVAHHFGMFDFNTVDPQVLRSQARAQVQVKRCIVPVAGEWYEVGDREGDEI